MNPFVSSLDIGLHTIKPKARSTELDDAIVAQLNSLLSGEVVNLPGGLQIIDSSDREGSPPPRQEVLARVITAQQKREGNDAKANETVIPFSWTSTRNEAREVDLRFLEDSIVSMSIEASSNEVTCSSVVPSLPIARRTLWEHPDGGPAVSTVYLGEEQASGLSGFAGAIDSFERLAKDAATIKRVAEIPAAATLKDRKARWLIAGNMNLDPRALSGALQGMQTGAVLWEWRPPYMERRASSWDTIVPARPYAVIANPSPDFFKQLENCVEAISGRSGATTAKSVMAELGTRGVGLASLLSMGHQQSRGAIGFFLAFQLLAHWEHTAPSDHLRMVIPLDAVNPVLQLLAGETVGETSRKADLLLLEARKSGAEFVLVVRPIEIKMHAAVGNQHPFPSAGSGGVQDAIEQLTQSGTVLAELQKRMAFVSEVPLLQSALSAVLETAISLSTGEAKSVARDLLAAAAEGRVDVLAVAGILLWFEAHGIDDGLSYTRGASGAQQYLMVDPRPLLSEAPEKETQAVAMLLEAMLATGLGGLEIPIGQASEEDGHGVLELEELAAGIPGVVIAGAPAVDHSHQTLDGSRGETPVAAAAQPVGASAAPDLHGMPVQIGWTKEGLTEEPLLFDPRDTRINQLNMGVVGDLGTGKTQFLKSLVFQLTRPLDTQATPPKAFIFDYKKDYVDPDFVGMVGARVLDPSQSPIPLNFFSVQNGAGKFEVASRALLFADTVDKIYSIGPNQHQALRTAVLNAYSDGGTPMLADVLERYQAATSSHDSVTSALSLMVDFGLFEPDPTKLVDFETLFDKSVVLALGNIAEAGTQVQNLLVTLFLNLLHVEYMKKRPKMPFVTGEDGITRRVIDSFVLVDEAHNIMNYEFESLRKLLLEGREFGMGVILSSQYLSHFKTKKTNWAEPLLTWAIHKVPNVVPAELNKLGFKSDLEATCDRISSLEVHRSLFKSPVGKAKQGVWVREKPFYEFIQKN